MQPPCAVKVPYGRVPRNNFYHRGQVEDLSTVDLMTKYGDGNSEENIVCTLNLIMWSLSSDWHRGNQTEKNVLGSARESGAKRARYDSNEIKNDLQKKKVAP